MDDCRSDIINPCRIEPIIHYRITEKVYYLASLWPTKYGCVLLHFCDYSLPVITHSESMEQSLMYVAQSDEEIAEPKITFYRWPLTVAVADRQKYIAAWPSIVLLIRQPTYWQLTKHTWGRKRGTHLDSLCITGYRVWISDTCGLGKLSFRVVRIHRTIPLSVPGKIPAYCCQPLSLQYWGFYLISVWASPPPPSTYA